MKTFVVHSSNQFSIEEVPVPEITSKQALVKTLACGICGTDATIIEQSFKGFHISDYPMMLGHEAVGEVVKIGSEVTSFQIGDIVMLPFTPAIAGNNPFSSGWGAFSEYGVVDDVQSYKSIEEIPETAYAQKKLPSWISVKEAPVLVTLREVYSAIQHFGIQKGQSIVVYGSGTVAITFVKLMRLLGIENITAVVRSEEKGKLLSKFGAEVVIDSSVGSVKTQLLKRNSQGVDFVLDAVGSEAIINEGLSLLKDRGEVLCYGVPKSTALKLNLEDAPYNWNINFQQMPRKEEEGACHEQIIQWVEEGKIVLSDFIFATYPFERITEAFEDYLTGKTNKKIIITY
ncbi:zinc-binding dehydrogenase [Psychrobacillus sp. FSL K6-2836]|uniref:zinc-dependent alcohol dehydrogenase n=1 Tax=Psychrobacillus sp. FSL K6-2836 TaxID=2921548 RepID=UPI0030F592F6